MSARWLRILAVLAVLVVAPVATAASGSTVGTDLARGFNPEGLYQFGNVDSINLFNGNLILTLPIGQSYPVTSSFGYQLTLTYNSKAWDVTTHLYGHPGT